MRRLIIGIILFSSFQVFPQVNSSSKYTETDSSYPNLCFSDKACEFTNPALLASEAFYELDDVKITIKRKSIKTMMAARPKANFLFKKREKREYVVIITDRLDMNANALFEHMSLDAQIGVLGHEFSHIVSYSEMSNFEMFWFGIKYVFNKKEIEAETDMMAVKKGFGKQIIEFNHYLHHSPRTNKKYLQKKKKYYLSATEIEQKIQDSL